MLNNVKHFNVMSVEVVATIALIFGSFGCAMNVPSPACNKELISKNLFARGIKKIHQALDQHLPPDEGTQLLIQAALEYNNPNAQYAIFALTSNNVIKLPEEYATNHIFERDISYYDFGTMSTIHLLIMKAKMVAQKAAQQVGNQTT